MHYFSDQEIQFKDALVILDLDGTLVPDGSSELSQEIVRAVKVLAAENTVYLSSNKRGAHFRERLEKMSHALGISHTDIRFRKPSRHVLHGIDVAGKNTVVIGDKYYTDGLFALRVGGKFIKVERIRGNEPLAVQCLYWLDDIFGATVFSWVTFFLSSRSR